MSGARTIDRLIAQDLVTPALQPEATVEPPDHDTRNCLGPGSRPAAVNAYFDMPQQSCRCSSTKWARTKRDVEIDNDLARRALLGAAASLSLTTAKVG